MIINKYLGFMVVLAGCFLFLGCAKPLTEKDNESRISIPVDGTFQIQLEGNPTTGYIWEIEKMDASMLRAVDDPVYEAKSKSRAGSGGVYTFSFKVVAAGASSLALAYHRPWEHDVLPAKRFVIEVDGGTMGQIESP
ncbi:MAG: hypothetical protein EOL87_04090 [Spartobacteria bacterium]|nr:hypothetical protein [Spartobacteria bacterium]